MYHLSGSGLGIQGENWDIVKQGCTDPGSQVAVATKFCTVAKVKRKGKVHPRTGHEGPEGE